MKKRIETVAICSVQVPFVRGGAELLVETLCHELGKKGYEAEIITIPFQWNPPTEILKQILMWRALDLTESDGRKIDLLIGCKFPAYYARHPNKVLWVMHQFRTAYDLWSTDLCDLVHYPEGPEVRRIIEHNDRELIPEAKRIFAISQTVTDRLRTFNGIESEPLYHPPPNFESLHCADWQNYIFYPSRLNSAKRQDLLVEAMRYVRTDTCCVIAGEGQLRSVLEGKIKTLRLGQRVKLLPFINEEEKVKLYANCLAVYYGPVLEDYGYVTLEALYSRKPLITLEDSGGPLEFVTHGENGLVTPPDPAEIARAIDVLATDRALAQRMGAQGFEFLMAKNVSWDHVITSLVAE